VGSSLADSTRNAKIEERSNSVRVRGNVAGGRVPVARIDASLRKSTRSYNLVARRRPASFFRPGRTCNKAPRLKYELGVALENDRHKPVRGRFPEAAFSPAVLSLSRSTRNFPTIS